MSKEADSKYLVVFTYNHQYKHEWQVTDRKGKVLLGGYKEAKYAKEALAKLLEKESVYEIV
jgi:hypothetical protein